MRATRLTVLYSTVLSAMAGVGRPRPGCRLPAIELPAVDWRAYLGRLYGEDADERVADQLDVLNLTMLSNVSAAAHDYAAAIAAALPRDASWGTCLGGGCNSSVFAANINVFCPIEFAWRLRMHKRSRQVISQGGFAPIAERTWTEATHCGGSPFEKSVGAFFYAARGSNLWINVGRTIAFGLHEEAVRHLLGRECSERGLDPQTGMRQCSRDLDEMAQTARARGYDTVQFTRRACCSRSNTPQWPMLLHGIARAHVALTALVCARRLRRKV